MEEDGMEEDGKDMVLTHTRRTFEEVKDLYKVEIQVTNVPTI